MPLTPNSEYADRRLRFSAIFKGERIDSFLVTALPNVRYLSGFTGSSGALLVKGDRAILFTDPRYQTQAPQESDCQVKIAKGPLLSEVLNWLLRWKVKRLGFERSRISFESYDLLKRQASEVKLRPVSDAIERLRMVKSPAEAATIRTAVELNSAAMDRALKQFRAEMTEADLVAEIEYSMRQLGADGPSFDTIVASGARTALPHAHPSSAEIKTDQLLLIDMGATVAGYTSDMTRTMGVGRVDQKARRMYEAVLESQLAAIDSVKAGALSSAVDRASRRVLRKHGLDKLFVHSTGHGLGLEIHESPRIGRTGGIPLESGMTITIEPGVYLEGYGGVRIEDTVVVTSNGCEVLTPTKKELIIL